MAMQDPIYLEKALECLEGAASEYSNRRYNNCANRAYYAAFAAAVYALETAGFSATGPRPTWSHEAAQAIFARELILRRKVYPANLRDTLSRTFLVRQSADYSRDVVSEAQASRALARAREFIGRDHGARRRTAMTPDRIHRPDARMQRAIDELTDLVRRQYPTASFAVGPSEEDAAVTHITATVDVDDPDEVVDLVIDRMLELQIEQGLSVYLIPVRTPERVVALRKHQREARQRQFPPLPVAPANS